MPTNLWLTWNPRNFKHTKINDSTVCIILIHVDLSIFIPRYKTEFGFTLPERRIIVDDVRVRDVGKALVDTEEIVQSSDEPPRVEAVSIIQYQKHETPQVCMAELQSKFQNLGTEANVGNRRADRQTDIIHL